MNIEIIIISGERKVDEDGTVTWTNEQHRRALVTYETDISSAKEEALRIAKSLLKGLQ